MKEYSRENIEQEVKKELSKLRAPNILICGQTGSGKSSVVNFLFKEDIAEISHGEPCTQDITLFKGNAYNLYDSEGYEIGSEKQDKYQKMIFDDFLEKKNNIKEDAVHLVWYTISGAGKRYTDLDIELINKIKSSYKVCVLVTKIDELDENQLEEFTNKINGELHNVPVFRLSNDNNELIQKFCDWDNLIEWSMNNLDEIFKDRFVAGLRLGLEAKRKQANIVIGVAVTAAAGVAASPIPFSDSALLVPIQTTMIIKILGIYGIKISDSTIVSLTGSVAVSAFGKAMAGNLLKFIPGLGTVVGDIINAGVASGITGSLGKSLEVLCYNQCKNMLDGTPINIDLEEILQSVNFIKGIKDAINK